MPVRLDWNGTRYYLEQPALPRGRMQYSRDDDPPLPMLVTGWELVASSVEGDIHVFIIISGDSGRWWLTALDPPATPAASRTTP